MSDLQLEEQIVIPNPIVEELPGWEPPPVPDIEEFPYEDSIEFTRDRNYVMAPYEEHKFDAIFKRVLKEHGQISEADAEEIAFDFWTRWKIETDLFFFGDQVLGWWEATDRHGRRHRVDPELHKWLCQVLQINDDKLILVPRFHLKTTWVKLRIVQLVLLDPNTSIGLFSITDSLVQHELNDIARILSTPILRRLWGPHLLPEPGSNFKNWERKTASEITVKRDPSAGKVPQEPQIFAAGLGTHIVGFHFKDAFMDDIIDDRIVRSPSRMDQALEWWQYMTFILEVDATTTMTGTPYHYSDLYAKIRRERHFDKIFVRSCREKDKTGLLKPIYSTWYTEKDLKRIEKRAGPYKFACHAKGTLITMADWTQKPIEQIQIGDNVVGWDLSDGIKRAKLRITKVIATGNRIAESVDSAMEDGQILTHSSDHRWWTGRSGTDGHSVYATLGEKYPQIQSLCQIHHPIIYLVGKQRETAAYLAGIFDGEGSFSRVNKSLRICQDSVLNPDICEKIDNCFDVLGVKVQKFTKKRRDRKGTQLEWIIQGHRSERLQFLSMLRPWSAKASKAVELLYGSRDFGKNSKVRLNKQSPRGRIRVYNIQTETGNYVASGFASKNCQMMCNPEPMELKPFPPPQPVYSDLPADEAGYKFYCMIDPAATTEIYSDKTAFTVAAVNHVNQVWVTRSFAIKRKGDVIADALIQLHLVHQFKKIVIELGLQEHLRIVMELKERMWESENRRKLGMCSKIEGVPVKKIKKGERIMDALGPLTRENKIRIHESCTELLDQMNRFTGRENDEDDLIDSLSMIVYAVPSFAVHNRIPDNFRRAAWTLRSIMDRSRRAKRVGWEKHFAN